MNVQVFFFRSLYVNSQKEKFGNWGKHDNYRFCNDQIMSKISSFDQDRGSKGATQRYTLVKEAGLPQNFPLPSLLAASITFEKAGPAEG